METPELDRTDRLILDALRPQRIFVGRGYFFACDLLGNFVLQPLNPALENTTTRDIRDDHDHLFVQGLMDAARSSPDGGFSTYRWYRPVKPQEMTDKLSHMQVFKR